MGYGQSTAIDNQEDKPGLDEERRSYTSVHISENQTCSVCNQQKATAFCACVDTVTFLCPEDQLLHIEDNQDELHTILPIRALSPITAPGFYEQMRHRFAAFTQGQEELLENLRLLDTCSQQYTTEITELVDSINRHRDYMLGQLQECRNRLEVEIWEAINSVADSLTQDSPDLISPLATNLRRYQPGNLALFYYKIDVASLLNMIESSIWFQIREPKPLGFEEAIKPIAVLNQEVKYFDIDKNRWEQLFPITWIKVDEESAFTFVGESKVFVCGGGKYYNMKSESYNTAYILTKTDAISLPTMATSRSAPGLLYDSVGNAVYVFGGINAFGYDALRSCEKFDLSSSQWQNLPLMHTDRNYFNPCKHSSVVYLCGGGCRHHSIETYHIQSSIFTHLRELKLPGCTRMGRIFNDAFGYTAVAQAGSVVIISESYLCKWNSQEQSISLTERPAWQYAWSRCTPVVRDGVVYLVNSRNKTASGINLETGEVEAEASYS